MGNGLWIQDTISAQADLVRSQTKFYANCAVAARPALSAASWPSPACSVQATPDAAEAGEWLFSGRRGWRPHKQPRLWQWPGETWAIWAASWPGQSHLD